MDIATPDPAIGRDRAFIRSVLTSQQRARQTRPGRAPHMHLEPLIGPITGDGATAAGLQHLVAAEDGVDVEQAQSFRRSRWPLDTVWVSERAPQHLEAAADAQHPPTPSDVGLEIDVPTLRP